MEKLTIFGRQLKDALSSGVELPSGISTITLLTAGLITACTGADEANKLQDMNADAALVTDVISDDNENLNDGGIMNSNTGGGPDGSEVLEEDAFSESNSWDAPNETSDGLCDTYKAGEYGTPTLFAFYLTPDVSGPITPTLTAGVNPAVGSAPSNSWTTGGAEFTLHVDKSMTDYPAVVVFASLYSIGFDIDDYQLQLPIKEVDLGVLTDIVVNDLECPPTDADCQHMKDRAINNASEGVQFPLAIFTNEYVANIAKCTFGLPGGAECQSNTYSMFKDTNYSGSFEANYDSSDSNQLKMYVAIVGCQK